MRRIRSNCCARAVIGHATTEPAIPLMKSRRRTRPSSERLRTTPVLKAYQIRAAMSALPPKADMCAATRDVRYGLKADIPIKHRIVVFPVVASNNRLLLIDADCSNYLQPLGLGWRLARSRKLGPKRSCFPS